MSEPDQPPKHFTWEGQRAYVFQQFDSAFDAWRDSHALDNLPSDVPEMLIELFSLVREYMAADVEAHKAQKE